MLVWKSLVVDSVLRTGTLIDKHGNVVRSWQKNKISKGGLKVSKWKDTKNVYTLPGSVKIQERDKKFIEVIGKYEIEGLFWYTCVLSEYLTIDHNRELFKFVRTGHLISIGLTPMSSYSVRIDELIDIGPTDVNKLVS